MSTKDRPEINEKVIRELLQYLVAHPDAKDTLEGIYKWWLRKGYSERGREEVQKALDLLTTKGWLTKRGTVPSKEIYGINKDRVQEIRSFLQRAGASS